MYCNCNENSLALTQLSTHRKPKPVSLLKCSCVLQAHSDSIDAADNGERHHFGLRIAYPEAAMEICTAGVLVGSGAEADVVLDAPMVS